MKNKLNSKTLAIIGGGTGTAAILRSLRGKVDNLHAIVAVTDDGGSTGRLRDDLDIAATGDLRSCLIALAEHEMLSDVMQHRFNTGELSGHAMGNLILATLIEQTGGLSQAVKECGNVLKLSGQVHPAMLGTPNLKASLVGGNEYIGEKNIVGHTNKINKLTITPDPIPNNDAIAAVKTADLIILSPGSLFTSIIAAILEPKLCRAISKEKILYICNIMTEYEETNGYNVNDHLSALKKYPPVDPKINHTLVNNGRIPMKIKKEYDKENAKPVKYNKQTTIDGTKVLARDCVHITEENKIRHAKDAVQNAISTIFSNDTE